MHVYKGRETENLVYIFNLSRKCALSFTQNYHISMIILITTLYARECLSHYNYKMYYLLMFAHIGLIKMKRRFFREKKRRLVYFIIVQVAKTLDFRVCEHSDQSIFSFLEIIISKLVAKLFENRFGNKDCTHHWMLWSFTFWPNIFQN